MFEYWVIKLLAVFLAVAVGIIIHYKIAFKYWKKRNLAQIQEPKIPFGDLPNIFPLKIYMGHDYKNKYDEAKSQGHKIIGYFQCSTAKCIPIDPEYIKNILQRDFSYFTERGFYYNEKDDPLSANLFAIGGDKWRKLRTKLSPAYTAGKIKTMFDGLLQCTYQMKDAMEEICTTTQTVNMKDFSERFTINVIGFCAFGIECNCFKAPESEFRKEGKKIFFFTFVRFFKTLFAFSYPTLGRWLGIRLFDKDTTQFFTNVVKESLKYREVNNLARNDFLQLLLALRNDDSEKHEEYSSLSTEELAAQVFIFFAAGFETSSITLAFCLYELALNEVMQNKAREEIRQILKEHRGNITYETIMDMKFINQIVKETLRKYPPVSFITRVAVQNYQIPGTDTILEKGIEAIISVLGLHRDPEYYPEPDKFDPERFSDENKQKRPPFTYMPFGEGPRICIGLRFGLMQVKVGLAVLLKHYKFSLNSKTKVPLEMVPYSFTLTPKNGIFLNVERVI